MKLIDFIKEIGIPEFKSIIGNFKIKQRNIYAVFHYLSLHKSPYFTDKHDGRSLNESDRYSNCLLRLPFFYNLNLEQQNRVISSILDFFNSQE